MKIAILTIVLLFLAVVMMAVKVLFVKGGRFPSQHVGHNAALRRRNIRCAHSDDDDGRK